MLGMWKKKPKPQPWYRKLWNEWKQFILMLSSVLSLLGGGFQYIALDTTKFIKTTEIIAAADASNVYIHVDVVSEVRETAYLNVTIDGQLVRSLVLPTGIREGDQYITIPIPFTSADQILQVDVEITFLGIRTAFLPQTIEANFDVEVVHENRSNTSYPSVSRDGVWV